MPYNIREKRIGEIGYNNLNSKMMIIEYNNNRDIIVEFQDEYRFKVHTSYQKFVQGKVGNPYDRTMRNIGYIGVGTFIPSQNPKMYNSWANMFDRCYNQKFTSTHKTYKKCIVDERFHCFQDFGLWFKENYYEVDDEIMCLDKDILIKGNKIYGPDTCIFIPDFINKLFPKSENSRGDLPVGVSYVSYESTKCYAASCSVFDEDSKQRKKIHLGTFNTINDAFLAYKSYKEIYIKTIADNYKQKIPEKVYNALYNYEVNIND